MDDQAWEKVRSTGSVQQSLECELIGYFCKLLCVIFVYSVQQTQAMANQAWENARSTGSAQQILECELIEHIVDV